MGCRGRVCGGSQHRRRPFGLSVRPGLGQSRCRLPRLSSRIAPLSSSTSQLSSCLALFSSIACRANNGFLVSYVLRCGGLARRLVCSLRGDGNARIQCILDLIDRGCLWCRGNDLACGVGIFLLRLPPPSGPSRLSRTRRGKRNDAWSLSVLANSGISVALLPRLSRRVHNT